MWIDREYQAVGDIGFVIETVREGRSRWHLRESPARTNQSHQPTLVGWCGETDNVSTHARGMARVVRVNGAGDRMMVEALTGEALVQALEACGYPELVA
jgi:hypothetical protein